MKIYADVCTGSVDCVLIPLLNLDIQVKHTSTDRLHKKIAKELNALAGVDLDLSMHSILKDATHRIEISARNSKAMFALILRRRREALGKSHADMARSAGMHNSYHWSRYESGKHSPTLRLAEQLLREVGVEMSMVCISVPTQDS